MTKMVGVRFTPADHQRIVVLAEKAGVSCSCLVRRLLAHALGEGN